MTTGWTITITVETDDNGDDGFVDYLVGEIDSLCENTEADGITVTINTEAS
jgi:hypothetical protein